MTGLTSAENLVLPAATTSTYCYKYMFGGCTSLTTAPEIYVINPAGGCCEEMFINCTSLTTAPSILPATTLGIYCYEKMFMGCTSLIQTPELPATTLVDFCYTNMFYGCSNLNYVKCLATDISAYKSTQGWLVGVKSTGTFVKHKDANWTTGDSGIPSGWTVQNAT